MRLVIRYYQKSFISLPCSARRSCDQQCLLVRSQLAGFVRSLKERSQFTNKIKHAIQLKTSPARLAQLLQPSLAFCFSLQPMTEHHGGGFGLYDCFCLVTGRRVCSKCNYVYSYNEREIAHSTVSHSDNNNNQNGSIACYRCNRICRRLLYDQKQNDN